MGFVEMIRGAVERFPRGMVKVISQEHRGPGATRNRAVAEASGEWIAFLDGDDLWSPQKVARLRETIALNPSATIIAHDEFKLKIGRGTDELLNHFDVQSLSLVHRDKAAAFATMWSGVGKLRRE